MSIEKQHLLVVGLGNPGPEYSGTRHNIGWAVVDRFAGRHGISLSRRRWRSLMGSGVVSGRPVWLLQPQTFMNLSGRAVREAVRDLEVEPASNLWVVHDELDLPFCRMKIRLSGSAAGNNGIRSIMGALGSDAFVRFRVGVGKPPAAGSRAGVDHVLGRFSKRDAASVAAVVDGVAAALDTAVSLGLERAMDLYNRAGALGCEEPA